MTRPEDKDADLLAAALAGLLRDAALAPSVAADLRGRILAAAGRSRTQVVRAEEGEWMDFVPGIRIKSLRKDMHTRTETSLWRLAPGAVIPPHPHASEEECLVLEGAIIHDGVEYRAGDYLLADAVERHKAFTSPGGALLMIRGELLPDPARVRALLEKSSGA